MTATARGACEPPDPGDAGATDTEGARPLRRDAEANRQQILDAAGRLMAERGLSTPLDDIAAAAGVGIGTLYRRFPTRADLVAAVFEVRVADYVADLEAAVAMADGWEAFTWFVRRSAARQIADRALSELIEKDLGPEKIRKLRERVLPLAETLVEHAKASGRLRADFTVSDLALVQHMLAAVGEATYVVGQTAWQRYLTIVLDGVVTARSEPTPFDEPTLSVADLAALHGAPPDPEEPACRGDGGATSVPPR